MSAEPAKESHVLYCYAPDLRPLAVLLSTVHFSSRANIVISNAGIHVEVEAGKTMQANAYMEKESFTEWSYNPPPTSSPRSNRAHSQFPSGELNSPRAEEEEVEDEGCKFEVSLTALLECLNVFGTATTHKSHARSTSDPRRNDDEDDEVDGRRRAARMREEKNKLKQQASSAIRVTYDGEGSPLVLLIEDSGVVTRCELVTYEAGELAEMSFPSERRVVHLILKSDWLRSAFALFDDKTASEISFIFSPPNTASAPAPKHPKRSRAAPKGPSTYNVPSHPYFRLLAEGSLGSSAIDFPNDKDILESFTCVLPPDIDESDIEEFGSVRNSYKLSHILKFRKALDVSSKASLRVDDMGLLSLQLLIYIDDNADKKIRKGYVEFLCVPLEEH
ncbi:hypothetical protein CROQUDRAFT_655510 [Cronartium quercuum f. sp. fusiforme G11]|uniref:Uncharacterized protein n=1 Tax=Cronartium quercuum f. sp. fusiforme G11 TaxID=708437 RepID=A0A9P6TD23_9BASI|nr:hypothetical protein CROQUDRAFT_655510 [Cronartium quercuum f. sp. fusiforme G11]